MLDDVITLPVDVLNDGNTVDAVFTRFEESLNRTVYISGEHSIELPDTLSFYRSPVKPSGNFKGVAKTATKFSKHHVVDGVDGVAQLASPLIIGISYSIPIGVTPAQVLVARQRAIALSDIDAIMDELNNRQSI